jgi:hypothetical protein
MIVVRALSCIPKRNFSDSVPWRGVVPESSASELLSKTFVDHFTFQQMEGSHILCYLLPGAEGDTEPGKRRINWVWYWNVPEAELPKLIMTGVDGRERDFSVPPGQVRGAPHSAGQGTSSRRRSIYPSPTRRPAPPRQERAPRLSDAPRRNFQMILRRLSRNGKPINSCWAEISKEAAEPCLLGGASCKRTVSVCPGSKR